MSRNRLNKLVNSTADAAFVVDDQGRVAAWNSAAEEFFGVSAEAAVGTPCGEILQGYDECGLVCSDNCSVRQAVASGQPVRNFDLHTRTGDGRKWCNVSVMLVDNEIPGGEPYGLHIIRTIDVRKRLEMAMRDFVKTAKSPDPAEVTAPTPRLNSANAPLTEREIVVLRLLAHGSSAAEIAAQLHLSRKTVSNHIQHAMQKLNAHTRLEAIRKGELAGLV